jgi:RHS repeat-associated protein
VPDAPETTTGSGSAPAPGATLPSIAVPKGGGAVRGIDEKVTVGLATGTASLSVPVPTTPGRAGFGPALALAYDSGGGNSPFGLGWHLPVPSISRKTALGLPRYGDADDSDVFMLSGAEDLVPLLTPSGDRWTPDVAPDPTGAYTVTRYRPRVEEDFQRIERWRQDATGDVHWRVISRDNVTRRFGQDASSRIADPADPSRVFTWLLDFTYDDRGNAMALQYKPEDSVNVPAAAHEQRRTVGANRHLKRILYGNTTPYVPAADDDPPAAWLFELVVDYGEHDPENPRPAETTTWPCRPDPYSSFRACFEIRTYRRCRRLLMFHRFPDGLDASASLVRSLDLTYAPDVSSDPTVPDYSLLTSIIQRGYLPGAGGVPPASEALPALTVQYSPLALGDTVAVADVDTLANLPAGVDGRLWRWLDLDGEGSPGIFTEDDGAWYYRRNISAYAPSGARPMPRFEPLDLVAAKPEGTSAHRSPQLVDLHGDGHLCAVEFAPPMPGYFGRDDDGGWGAYRPFPATAAIDWADPNVRLVDLDGDGLADVLLTDDDAFTWFPWLAEDGFGAAERVVTTRDENAGPALVLDEGDFSVYLADMSGDGLSDLVRIRNGEVCYWPNIGYGRFGPRLSMDDAPRFDAPDLFDGRRIQLADIDGSGTADLLYLGTDGVRVWMNASGNGYTEPTLLAGIGPVDDVTSVATLDLLGTGTSSLVWSSPLPGEAGRQLRYVELTGGVKPHLLTSATNGMGSETTLTYATSTHYYVEDLLAGTPWVTRLPFPVHVVARTQATDRIASTTVVSSYSYHHGHFDGVEREFRGFGRVDRTDTDSFPSASGTGAFTATPPTDGGEFTLPPVLARTWVDTGAYVGGDAIAAVLASEWYQGDPEAAHLAATDFSDAVTPEEMREACRALRGKPLRIETYGLDGSALAATPYAVAESRYRVTLLQPPAGSSDGSVYACQLESLSSHYERVVSDPRVTHTLTLSQDEFGAVTKSATVAYPRRTPAFPEQGTALVTYVEHDAANFATEADWYRIGLPVESGAYELTGLAAVAPGGLYDVATLLGTAATATEIPFEQTPDGSTPQKRLLNRSRTIYRANDLSAALPVGQVQSLALVERNYELTFTPGLVALAYSAAIPVAEATTQLTGAGAFVDLDGDGNLWAPSPSVFYSPAAGADPPAAPAPDAAYAAAHFYLARGHVDSFGGVTAVSWEHDLVPVATTDPAGNTTAATVNYRVLQPWLVIDPNENRTACRYDALGMVTAYALMGKALPDGTDEGDHLDLSSDEAAVTDDPTTTYEYAVSAYGDWMSDPTADPQRPVPVSARTRTRVTHKDPATAWLESWVYVDGQGRVALTKVQAEPGRAPVRDAHGTLVLDGAGALTLGPTSTRWVGTGRTIYDNKGNAVKTYEPFFDSVPDYTDEADLVEWGVTAITTYDPLSRAVRVDLPDGTYTSIALTAWRRLSSDGDDNVLDSAWYAARIGQPAGSDARDAATKAAACASTPAVSDLDPLGRVFHTTADGPGGVFQTTLQLTVQSRLVATIDSLGRTIATTAYDLTGGSVGTVSLDSGQRRLLPDCAGRPLLSWDSRGCQVRRTYDVLRRPVGVYVTETGSSERLASLTVYGEAQSDAVADNLRGSNYQEHDESGLATVVRKDFKGNIVSATRQLVRDYVTDTDWSASPGLDPQIFTSAGTYDALSRPVTATTPDASITTHSYNERGLIAGVTVVLAGTGPARDVVQSISYDAIGQRESVVLGNGVTTTYTYDPETLRLVHLTSARASGPLQDLSYVYDAAANITRINDAAQQTVFFDNQVVAASADYTYDAIYRLVKATGREHASASAPPQTTWDDSARVVVPLPTDGQAMVSYTETYVYDLVGNLQTLTHAASSGGWSRAYAYADGNRLASTTIAAGSEPYGYDANGNVTAMPQLSLMRWDWSNQLAATATQVVSDGTSPTTYYRYDKSGQRTIKATDSQAGTRRSQRVYLGPYELYREFDPSGNVTLETATLHVTDETHRVCVFETRFQLGNHLGSSMLETDETGAMLTYEEYYPFGSTSLQTGRGQAEVSTKRYRFTGRERDGESGLDYHHARHYAPWLGRWISCDPLGNVDGPSPYVYARDAPIVLSDPGGTLSTGDIPDHDELPSQILDLFRGHGDSGGGHSPGILSSLGDALAGIGRAIASAFSAAGSAIAGAASAAWNWVKGAASSAAHWVAGAARTAWNWTTHAAAAAWDWTKHAAVTAANWTARAVSAAWDWTKHAAASAWNWTKSTASAVWNWTKRAAAWTWNWVLAPTIRTATNALVGAVIGGLAGGPVGAIIGGIAGAGTGAVHGWEMASAHSYDWSSGAGWGEFLADNTWSLPNSFVASIFATINAPWNPVDATESRGTGQLVFQHGWAADYATTFGNVTVGQHPEVHERFHATQARIFGPLFYPSLVLNYAVNLIPWWWGYHKTRYPGHPITSVGEYFSRGVYPHVWAEDWAYKHDPNSSPQ